MSSYQPKSPGTLPYDDISFSFLDKLDNQVQTNEKQWSHLSELEFQNEFMSYCESCFSGKDKLIQLRRGFESSDLMAALENGDGGFTVKFIRADGSEEAGIDYRGPTREALYSAFNRILLDVFDGNESILINKVSHAANDYYKKAGMIMAFALLHEACDLQIFSAVMTECLVSKNFKNIEVAVDDILDPELRATLKGVDLNPSKNENLLDDSQIQSIVKVTCDLAGYSFTFALIEGLCSRL